LKGAREYYVTAQCREEPFHYRLYGPGRKKSVLNEYELIQLWKNEESIAHIHGWDFSHIYGRYTEEDELPWDYRQIIEEYLKPGMKLLDIDTGGASAA